MTCNCQGYHELDSMKHLQQNPTRFHTTLPSSGIIKSNKGALISSALPIFYSLLRSTVWISGPTTFMAERISTRISFRWLPDPPSEPTDTLVFNVGSYFMDLRILKADGSIEWGMAGERQILSMDPCLCCPSGYLQSHC